MTFGEKLKAARKEAGLSQEQLAEKLSVSRSAVAKWEADGGLPDVSSLKAMAQLLGVSIDYLLDEDERITFNEVREAIDLITHWGASQLVDYAGNSDGYYLVEKEGRQYLVRVSEEFIITSELAGKVDPKKFTIGNNVFRKSTYRLI